MKLPMFTALGLGIWESAVITTDTMETRKHYRLAREAADARCKPLLVVGGPGASPIVRLMKIPRHGCGDVCLDVNLTSCSICGAAVEQVEADVRCIPYPNKHFGAAFASHVLEHLPTPADALDAFNELKRVADEVHVVSPTKLSLVAWLHPGHRLWVRQVEGSLEATLLRSEGERLFV